jgi:hypothetical protein
MQGKPPVLRVRPRGGTVRVPNTGLWVCGQGGGLLYSCVVTRLPCRSDPRECPCKKCRKSTPLVATLQLYRGDPQDRCQVLGTPAPLYRPLGLSPAAGFIFDDVLTLWSCRGYPAEAPLCAPGFAGGGSGFDIPLRG